MQWLHLRRRFSRLDLQVKVVLVLILVIAPIYILVNFAALQTALPVIEEELRGTGMHAARTLTDEIASKHLFSPGKEKELEQNIREGLYNLYPSGQQIDAFRKGDKDKAEFVASTEDDVSLVIHPPNDEIPDRSLWFRKTLEDGSAYWEIWWPVFRGKKIMGAIRVEVSLRNAAATMEKAIRKIMLLAGAASIVLLVLALSYALRKTISNDRLLRRAESQNTELNRQLHEAERQVMIKEKLAAMGQLTASFAHEIGTPLNAMGGHLQLLQDDLRKAAGSDSWLHRLGIIGDQLLKIENIVKSFLQSTAKAPSQHQLLDVNQVLEKTLGIVSPRIETLGIRVEKNLDRSLGPIRAVPIDIEQILLNLLNNSLDSVHSKLEKNQDATARIEILSRSHKEGLSEWVELSVYDSGEGIAKAALQNVFKPFYTTKAVGEGTGLGLTICQEIARKYRGRLTIESKEGSWTRVVLQLPYGEPA